MKIKVDHEHPNSLSSVASLLLLSINQGTLSRRLQQHPAVVPLSFLQPELYGMRSLKRVFSRSKKSPSDQDKPQLPPEKPEKYLRRRSKSMTLHTDNWQKPLGGALSKHAKRGIKASDIRLVLDISSENAAKLSQHSQYQSTDESRDDTSDYLCDDIALLLDQFPTPPQHHAYSSSVARIPILNTDYGLPPGEILPPPTPQLQRYMVEQKASSVRRQPLSRTSSNASFSRPTPAAYGFFHESTGPNNKAYPPSTTLTRPSYRTHHNNLSTRSLGAEVMIRPGPLTHRAIVHQQSRSDPGPSTRSHYAKPIPDVPVDVMGSEGSSEVEPQRVRVVEPLGMRSTAARSRTAPIYFVFISLESRRATKLP